jgi:hypothetical protein
MQATGTKLCVEWAAVDDGGSPVISYSLEMDAGIESVYIDTVCNF